MKKVLLAILCASMLISSVSVTAFADDEISSETTATEETKITDIDEIYNIIKPYIEENYPSGEGWYGVYIFQDREGVLIKFGWHYFSDERDFFKENEKIRDFVKKSNIDESMVVVIKEAASPGTTELTTTEPTETTEPTAETTATTEPKKIILGDLNNDEISDSKDAVVILKNYAENLVDPSKKVNLVGDINKDGKVDSKDAVIILRYYANKLAGTYNGSIEDFK